MSDIRPIRLSRFTKDNGPLTKVASVTSAGELDLDPKHCMMASGKAEIIDLTSGLRDLLKLLPTLAYEQALERRRLPVPSRASHLEGQAEWQCALTWNGDALARALRLAR